MPDEIRVFLPVPFPRTVGGMAIDDDAIEGTFLRLFFLFSDRTCIKYHWLDHFANAELLARLECRRARVFETKDNLFFRFAPKVDPDRVKSSTVQLESEEPNNEWSTTIKVCLLTARTQRMDSGFYTGN